MDLKWIIEKNLIFGYNDNNILNYHTKNIKKVLIFDLDYTLIKTKTGKKFPQDKNDWEFLYENISDKLNNLSETLIGIVSNQKGLKTDLQKNDWIYKINQINKIIKFDFVFASIIDDKYRKPLPDSFYYIKKNFNSKYNNIEWENLINNKKIYYIGDAFGRKKDFSDTDIKYALNNNFKFKTPELFFKKNLVKEIGSINYPNINYFTKYKESKFYEELDNLIKLHKKIFIITIGFPASGKTFLRNELIKKYSKFTYFNNDDIHKKVKYNVLISKLSTEYDFIIDDNTNINKNDREKKLKQFETYYKIGIWFNYDFEVYWHLNWLRMYYFGYKLLPKVIYYTLRKKLDSNNIDKGFDKFITINKVFNEMNINNKIKYYF
jgi:bifunctional polynucleotide phosphatase/kinase